MDSRKLKEALLELQAERTVLNTAISSLENIIDSLNGGSRPERTSTLPIKLPRPSFLNITMEYLDETCQPTHIKDITHRISKVQDRTVSRNSVQATFSRYINNHDDPQIVKVGPGMFAMADWPQAIKDLWVDIIND